MVTPVGRLEQVAGPAGPLDLLTVGRGQPSTIFAHGAGSSIETTRPFASGVRGAHTFFHFRGHGRSVVPDLPWSYADLAAELRAVADHVGATRALGVSLGAGALLRLLCEDPGRFERVVLVLPAGLDRARRGPGVDELQRLGRRIAEGDRAAAVELYRGDGGAGSTARGDAADAWAEQMADQVVAGHLSAFGIGRALTTLPGQVPVPDVSLLGHVRVPVLVLGQEEDVIHPASVARRLGEIMPAAEVEVLPPGGLLWAHRSRVRTLVSTFLDA